MRGIPFQSGFVVVWHARRIGYCPAAHKIFVYPRRLPRCACSAPPGTAAARGAGVGGFRLHAAVWTPSAASPDSGTLSKRTPSKTGRSRLWKLRKTGKNCGFPPKIGVFAGTKPGFVPANSGFVPAKLRFVGANRRFVPAKLRFVATKPGFVPANSGFAGANRQFVPTKRGFVPANRRFAAPISGKSPGVCRPTAVCGRSAGGLPRRRRLRASSSHGEGPVRRGRLPRHRTARGSPDSPAGAARRGHRG